MWLQDPCLFLILKENVAYLTQLSQNALAFINSQRKEKGNVSRARKKGFVNRYDIPALPIVLLYCAVFLPLFCCFRFTSCVTIDVIHS